MSDPQYSSLNAPPPQRSGNTFVKVFLVLFLVAGAVVATFFVTKHKYDKSSSSSTYDSSKAFVIPQAYEVEVEFRMPYITSPYNFSEPVYAYVDHNKQKQMLSYYAGMDTYVYNAKGNWFMITPVVSQFECFGFNQSSPLVDLFPVMKYFTKADGQKTVTTKAYPDGVTCDIWRFEYSKITQDVEGNASATLPQEGYVGDYYFYVSEKDGSPVRFHMMIGHNVVLGGSHQDEYIVDYLTFLPRPSIPDVKFESPRGMDCSINAQPTGPTYWHGDGRQFHADVVRSNAQNDLLSLFPSPRSFAHKQAAFSDYVHAHRKQYTNAEERAGRHNVFHSNLRYINAMNRKGLSYRLSANHFADLTPEERSRRNSYKPAIAARLASTCTLYDNISASLPKNVDWRKGCPPGAARSCTTLTLPPKDQGTCGSCWTFGTTGAIEAAQAYKHGTITPLSQQSIVDCAWFLNGTVINMGCRGGGDYLAYRWLLENNGGKVASAMSYGPYLSQNGFCHYDLSASPPKNTNDQGKPVVAGATIQECFHVTKQWHCTSKCVSDLNATLTMSTALSAGKVLSVAIDATLQDFYFYHSGWYYNSKCGNGVHDLDHQVLAVGYETGPDGERYTIIKNSWSDHWGENGFVKLSQKNNCCGAATQPTFVEVA